MGVLGYQQPFIPNYADITQPLTELTKNDHCFVLTTECCQALDTLISTVLTNLSRPYFLQINVFAYTTEAILAQKDQQGKHMAVGYYSQSFSKAE